MKVKIFCDNGANVYSKRFDEVETEDLGFTENKWRALSEEEKAEAAQTHVNENGWIEIWYEESEENE